MHPAFQLFKEQGKYGLTAGELAVVLTVHTSTVRRLGIDKTYVGRRVIYPLPAIEAYLEANTVKAAKVSAPIRAMIGSVIAATKTENAEDWAARKRAEYFN